MNLGIDNMYGFKDFKINFSYPKKIVNSSIPHEYLEEKPNFRFKRVNILMGANASGKTTLGKMLMTIFNFLDKKNIDFIYEIVSEEDKKASFELDFVFRETQLYRVYCEVLEREVKKIEIKSAKIRKDDSYERCSARLKVISTTELLEVEDEQEKVLKVLKIFEKGMFGWMFCFPNQDPAKDAKFDLKVLNVILKTFDTSIERVEIVDNAENGHVIVFKNNKTVMLENGKALGGNILSSGTQEAVAIAHAVSEMKKDPERPFYIDEKFSHAQTDIEAAILNLMISLISPKAQIFFTTHNTDILEQNLPIHSFTFLKKNENIETVYPSEIMKKNDRLLINAVKNDIFKTLPNTDHLYGLLEVI